eukprot:TRINITY_DN5519_c0_g1_i5.p2 TRINITY_DN5519_c0_g1~~TRINITY_DN5519_c0_g1_i5.p2  ORF type:complete len:247 (+),score=119.55 TRINITY_DN5519_c0_g1_i5:115-855(+)
MYSIGEGGSGSSHLSMSAAGGVGKEEPSMREEWMEKIGDIKVPRAAMNKLVMNYLVMEGFKDAAERFQEEAGISPGQDLGMLDNRINIRDSIQAGKIEEAISLVNQLHPQLLDNDRYLLFHLQQQHLIELIREQKIEEALQYAAEHLAERGEEDSTVLQELERTLALLAFDDPASCPFADLLTPAHRQQVASKLNAAILMAEHADSTQSKLAVSLKMLLWAQDELDKKRVRYPHMQLSTGQIEEPK